MFHFLFCIPYEPFSITFEEIPITCMLFQECLSKRAYLVWSTLSHNIQTIFIICDVSKMLLEIILNFNQYKLAVSHSWAEDIFSCNEDRPSSKFWLPHTEEIFSSTSRNSYLSLIRVYINPLLKAFISCKETALCI